MSASSKHDARPRLVCTTSMATTTNWAQLVVATIALGLRCSNHRFRSLHQFFNYPLDLLPTLDAIVANKKFSSGFPSLKNVMSSWCWPGDRILGLGEEVIQVVQVSLICFFITFLNLLVFFLFFQKVQIKKNHLPPQSQHVTLFFFAWKMTFPFEMVPFLGDIRSFSGGSNWFPRCELPVYHRSGWLWHHPLPAWAGELNKQSGMVKTWSFQSVDLQRDKVRSRRR